MLISALLSNQLFRLWFQLIGSSPSLPNFFFLAESFTHTWIYLINLLRTGTSSSVTPKLSHPRNLTLIQCHLIKSPYIFFSIILQISGLFFFDPVSNKGSCIAFRCHVSSGFFNLEQFPYSQLKKNKSSMMLTVLETRSII